ncbi:MAG: protein kinase [Myxococcales bacterium]
MSLPDPVHPPEFYSESTVEVQRDLVRDGASSVPGPGKAPAFDPLEEGEVIGHYELIRKLGQGGMSTVYLARDNRLGRRVAMKFLDDRDPELGKRFVTEARITARCSHENIVVIYEADEWKSHPYIVLEYLQGQPLTDLIVPGRPMPFARAVDLMIPVVKALVCAHGAGIVHRDLKPDNIYVTESGTIKVLDFGVAKLLKESLGASEGASGQALIDFISKDSGTTRRDMVIGTLSYMSPEQWTAGEIDARSDIWTVGVILFKLLAGRPPLEGKQLPTIAELEVPMPRLGQEAASVPPGLADVVDRCLRKRKDERFPDAVALLAALEVFQAGRTEGELKVDENPFPGLTFFQESDAHRFFGRDQEIGGFVNRLREQPLLAVVGPSGSGKSSFVRAGVAPALKRFGDRWDSVVIRPGRRPMEAVADALVATSGETVEGPARDELIRRLRQEPGYAGAAFRENARRGKKRVLLHVDQVEELFTLVPDEAERRAFTACLASIADDPTSPTRVVLSVRSDFLDRLAEDERFMAELAQGLVFLSPPTRAGLADALVKPAEMAGYRFESPEIVEDMLSHLQTSQGALPLLQFAASKLWDCRDAGRKLLTQAGYQSLGGVAGALAGHADSVVSGLPAPSQKLARALLPRLVTPERTRALVPIQELHDLAPEPAQVDLLVDLLVRARLLMAHTGTGGAMVELVHGSLITNWPLLQRWLEEQRDDLVFREQLRTAAKQWDGRGRPQGLLWRGEAMQEARLWRSRHSDELPGREHDFLSAVFRLDDRARRVKQAVVAGIISMLSLIIVGGAVALYQVRKAERGALEQAELASREAERAGREAERAKAAEAEVKQQLEVVKREQAAKAQAQAEVKQGKEDLRSANDQLKVALAKAESESVKARSAAEQARSAADQAQKLAGSLQEANSKLTKLLATERARAEKLEAERKKITTELR